MFNRIIVPVDGSHASWRATSVGDRLAAICEADLELVYVESKLGDPVKDWIDGQIEDATWTGSPPTLTLLDGPHGAARAIADHFTSVNGAMLVMASNGRGRSEVVLGSVMAEVLSLTAGPLIVVGPNVEVTAEPKQELLVSVDGSDLSETALGLAGAWGIGLHLRPWVVSVAEPGPAVAGDASESGYVARAAHQLSARTGRDTEFEVLHDDHPARAITQFAESLDAGLIVMATHGRGGLARLRLGSVAADVVRHARCPVVLMRPPELLFARGGTATDTVHA
jgi:nucleotide-binding universal stress UspA family protein